MTQFEDSGMSTPAVAHQRYERDKWSRLVAVQRGLSASRNYTHDASLSSASSDKGLKRHVGVL